MLFRYERTGAERKALVKAISDHTGFRAEYLGAPGFMYRVGGYTISVDGVLDTGDTDSVDIHPLLVALEECGFVPSDDTVLDERRENKAPAVLSIDLPAEGVTDTAFDNLQKLVTGKAVLIRMAIGNDLADGMESLLIVRENDSIGFPWFHVGMDSDAVAAWTMFVSALCKAAKKQKRVVLKERPLDDGASIKFLTRCFLLKIGMIGDEYKAARRIILAGLPGNASYLKPNTGEELVCREAV